MSRISVRPVIVAAVVIAAVGLGASWLLLAGNSPLSSWLTGQPPVTNIASAVNLPATLFALSRFPGNPAPSDAAVVLVAMGQWLIYGAGVAGLWRMWRTGD